MATTIEIPDFDFSGLYFGDIRDALIQYKRINVPEHTDESDYDPLMQFLTMQALVGHLSNVLIDLVANENTLPTARLVETVRNMLRLIDYELRTASPAQSDIVYELSKVFTTSFEIINEDAQAATERQGDLAPVIFERGTAVTIDRTDQFSWVFGVESAVFTDHTSDANSQTTPADDWTPWTGAVAAKDVIYFGHNHILWNQLGLWFTTPMSGTVATGSIQFVAKASLVNGETFVLDDGTNPAVTFVFDVSGSYIPPGIGYSDTNIRIDVSGATTSQDVALLAQTEINGAPTLDITASAPGAGILTFVNDNFGTAGNQTITETVADGGFTVAGMSGGTEGIVGIWEYYDGDFQKTSPSEVQIDIPTSGKLLFDLTGYLGADDRTGTQIRVRLNETTAFEDVESAFGIPAGSGWGSSRNYVIVNSYLGQTSPSTDVTKYTVGSDWEEFTGLTDGSAKLSQNGNVTFTLPQSVTENWIAGTINSESAYWIRYRVISVTGLVNAPTFQYGRLDQGAQYVLSSFTQGQTQIEDPLGSSDGTANQRFETSRDNFISSTMEFSVEGEQWTEVENFLSSSPTEKHFIVEIGENDRATVVTGDGVTGKIPTSGVNNVASEYRYGAEEDGNVGADTITVNKSSLSYINRLWNPRPAAGWAEAQGADEESLEQAKIAGPASLRTKDVALSPDDVETQTKDFTDADGASPFSRSKAIEEGFGPKTVENIVVAKGGGQASTAQLDALDEHFNGDQFASPQVAKHLVANQEVTSVNYTPSIISVIATVYGNVTDEEVKNRLQSILQPEALKADGVSFEWEFGGDVPKSRLSHEIFETDESITKVTITLPLGDVALATRALPTAGTLSITVITP